MRQATKKAVAKKTARKAVKKTPSKAPKVVISKSLMKAAQARLKAGKELPGTLKGHPLGFSGVQKAIKAMVKLNKSDDKAKFRQRHVDLAMQIINAEPLLIGGRAICESAGHCASAALLFAVGASNKAMLRGGVSGVSGRMRYRLWKVFRIDNNIIDQIIHSNDSIADDMPELDSGVRANRPTKEQVKSRREKVRSVLESFVGDTIENPTDYTFKRF